MDDEFRIMSLPRSYWTNLRCFPRQCAPVVERMSAQLTARNGSSLDELLISKATKFVNDDKNMDF